MIPLFDSRRQTQPLRPQLDAALAAVLDRGSFVLGDRLRDFEQIWASYCGARFCVGTGSGMDALTLSLKALGVGPGDQVAATPNVVYGALAARLAGADLLLIDVDPDSGLMDLAALQSSLTSRTKVILPTHLYGRMLDMEALRCIAAAHNCRLVEDACQAHGAVLNGRKAGAWSDAGCFSFYPSKNLGAFGEAGAVVTDDPDLAASLRMLRNYGQRDRYRHDLLGPNSRLDELQAAILSVKLPHLDAWNASRRRIASLYYSRFSNLRRVRCLAPSSGAEHVHHLFVVKCDHRDDLRSFLAQRGIDSQIHYPVPVHLQPAFAGLGHSQGHFPHAEMLSDQVLSLPLFPELTSQEISHVVRSVEAFDAQVQAAPLTDSGSSHA